MYWTLKPGPERRAAKRLHEQQFPNQLFALGDRVAQTMSRLKHRARIDYRDTVYVDGVAVPLNPTDRELTVLIRRLKHSEEQK